MVSRDAKKADASKLVVGPCSYEGCEATSSVGIVIRPSAESTQGGHLLGACFEHVDLLAHVLLKWRKDHYGGA